MQAQIATLNSKVMSLEQQIDVVKTSLESEKSCCKVLNNDILLKAQRLLEAEQEVEALKEKLVEVTKRSEENENHVSILASSCNESKLKLATKDKVHIL